MPVRSLEPRQPVGVSERALTPIEQASGAACSEPLDRRSGTGDDERFELEADPMHQRRSVTSHQRDRKPHEKHVGSAVSDLLECRLEKPVKSDALSLDDLTELAEGIG